MFPDNPKALDARRTRGIWPPAAAGLALAISIGAGALFVSNKSPAAPTATPPVTVTVSVPMARQVNEWDNYVGRFEASRTVDVRPRVSGQIVAVHFADGAIVKQGQLLFSIDPRPYAAALAEAQAALASAKSDLALAQTDLGRAGRLSGEEALSRSELDRLRARVQAATASVAGAQARVQARSLDMEFTEVRAPIAGRVSDRRVDPGNLVAAGEGSASTLLTKVNALDPIYFSFDASEALFLKTRRAQDAGQATSPVAIRLQDETDYQWQGKIDFTDNGLDPRSGTIRVRAVIANTNLFLTPGMFGNMRLASGAPSDALLVPDAAIQTDQARKTVLTVTEDGTVAVKPVVLGPVIDGLRIIRSGLVATDRVVISGLLMATPGTKVLTKPAEILPMAAPQIKPSAPSASAEASFAS